MLTTTKLLLNAVCICALLAACNDSRHNRPVTSPAQAAGIIDQFEVVSSVPAFNGVTPPGASGPYQVITGIVHGKLNPSAPDNAGIVDLQHAPLDADGYVAYTTDVVILRPQNAHNARRVLFYDVVNRGNKLGQTVFIGGGPLVSGTTPAASMPSLLQYGYTIVWSGWQGDIAQTGNGASAAVGTRFPSVTQPDGSAITSLSREEFIPDTTAGPPNTIPLSYAPASSADRSEVIFTARQSWRNGAGRQDYAAPSAPVDTWSYVQTANGATAVSFTPPATVPGPGAIPVAPDAGTIYSFVYRAKDPKVNGIGLAAVRDLISFLRYNAHDAQGNPNPLNDLKTAACAAGANCADQPTTNVDIAIGEGISQSGRFLRDFLYLGFNRDAHGNKVFDGLIPVIPGARKTWLNTRFSQIGRWSKQHEDHWMPGDQFPFAYNVITDPLSGMTDGLLRKCTTSDTCPKVMQLDGSFEWWGGRASLVLTDGAGRDVSLPDNVRYYLVASTQHGGGAGVASGVLTLPPAGSLCQFPNNPASLNPVARALIPALERWLTHGTPPPPSRYPTVAAGELVATSQTALGFPDLSNIVVPNGVNATPTAISLAYDGNAIVNQLFVTDYSNAVPLADLSRQYTILVPKVDRNGNETAGILVPDLAVPLATYTGWNLRTNGHAVGEACSAAGAAIPFAINQAAKTGGADSRAALADLYSGRADYRSKVSAAANALVSQGYLLQLDADNVFSANADRISAALIPLP
ncbi:alpha/beta hydrolase domain-containing protein [Paraherbaspirillum soli]|uniref:Alpha/beta hydrolase domain-containing protein n=1 Tax=Paraherbaspirillum soli TaxID=631222 RepID=A0ABW0MDH7_9BURK